ncbi:MAG: hypothetical protein ACI8WA_001017, partial [Polaribacter sp.]
QQRTEVKNNLKTYIKNGFNFNRSHISGQDHFLNFS